MKAYSVLDWKKANQLYGFMRKHDLLISPLVFEYLIRNEPTTGIITLRFVCALPVLPQRRLDLFS